MENTTNSFSKELLSTLRTSLHLQGMADAYPEGDLEVYRGKG